MKLFLSLLLVSSSALAQNLGRAMQASDRVLVTFPGAPTFATQASMAADAGHSMVRPMASQGVRPAVVRLPEGTTVEAAIAYYTSLGGQAQPSFRYEKAAPPDDPLYGQQWGLKNYAQQVMPVKGAPNLPVDKNNPGTANVDIGAEGAWEITTEAKVPVCVVDSGLNYNHVDIIDNLADLGSAFPLHGFDFVDGDNDPMDYDSHGTHVAGTILGVGNNGIGGSGVAWKGELLAARVLDQFGSGYTEDIVDGVNFCVAQGAKVINMSLGGPNFDPAFNVALAAANTAGVIIVVAAGNSNANNDVTPSYPCNYAQPNILCVAAVDQKNERAFFSSYGLTSVDIGAPGVNIVSNWAGLENFQNDPLLTGWTFLSTSGSPWDYLQVGATHFLATPANFGATNAKYLPSTDSITYKNFDLSSADSAGLSYSINAEIETNRDFLNILCKEDGGDPRQTGGEIVDEVSGSSKGLTVPITHNLQKCLGAANASIGLQFTSDGANQYRGAAISELLVRRFTSATTLYNVIKGTSMAAPHVAGVAALVYGYNPSYTVADVITAVKEGGTTAASLAGKTVTGKTLNAHGALTYLAPPSDFTASN